MNEMDIRKKIIETGLNLVKDRLVQGTWGNISMRIDDEYMIVTPSGLDYSILKPEDLPKVSILDTKEWTGPYKPTTERKVHAAIYRSRPDVMAVIHTHPMNASVFASSRKNIPLFNDELKSCLKHDVIVSKYALPGTKKMQKVTTQALGENDACLLANHGAFSCGKTMEDAYNVLATIEKACEEYLTKK
ncbi:MAG: class II aldolase/adducin family protein [Christensenellales bacterium]|jgi:L-ribulose-5-phosphate 4-epimerase|nr:class II aldolase/adducin family protein [Clostridiales bacterium]